MCPETLHARAPLLIWVTCVLCSVGEWNNLMPKVNKFLTYTLDIFLKNCTYFYSSKIFNIIGYFSIENIVIPFANQN